MSDSVMPKSLLSFWHKGFLPPSLKWGSGANHWDLFKGKDILIIWLLHTTYSGWLQTQLTHTSSHVKPIKYISIRCLVKALVCMENKGMLFFRNVTTLRFTCGSDLSPHKGAALLISVLGSDFLFRTLMFRAVERGREVLSFWWARRASSRKFTGMVSGLQKPAAFLCVCWHFSAELPRFLHAPVFYSTREHRGHPHGSEVGKQLNRWW